MFLPLARNTDILVQTAGNELLVYDLKTDKAFNLNETSRLIYDHCDGQTTFNDLKLKNGNLTDDIIFFALDELKRKDLITGEHKSVFAGQTRREVIKKIGFASLIALPVISSIIAPTASQAQSASLCDAANCVDGGPGQGGGCNPPNGCGALGAGIVCCAASNGNCTCTTAAICLNTGREICP